MDYEHGSNKCFLEYTSPNPFTGNILDNIFRDAVDDRSDARLELLVIGSMTNRELTSRTLSLEFLKTTFVASDRSLCMTKLIP